MIKRLVADRLPADATISSMRDHLAAPEEYVRRVFKEMGLRRDHQVRIALVTDAEAPDYKIEGTPSDGGAAILQFSAAKIFNGSTHRERLSKKVLPLTDWSTEAMPWSQVQALLGTLRAAAPTTPVETLPPVWRRPE